MIKYIARGAKILSSVLGLAVTGDINFDDAPSGDLSLDDIFGDQSNTPTTVEPPASATPQDTTLEEPFLKAKTGTVYKTREDAVTGIERKDSLIAELRQKLEQQTGVDPIRRQPEPKPSKSYLEDQESYFSDIASAVEKKDTRAYMEAQQKLILDTLGPIAPTLNSLSRAHAEQVVAQQIPEFKGFLSSEDYRAVAQDAPLLADAIKAAEANPAAAAQLPELYRVAYLAAQGRRVPELIQSAARVAPVSPRPTVHSTPTTPPGTNQQMAQPSLDTREGRKVLIEQMEGKGVGNLKW